MTISANPGSTGDVNATMCAQTHREGLESCHVSKQSLCDIDPASPFQLVADRAKSAFICASRRPRVMCLRP